MKRGSISGSRLLNQTSEELFVSNILPQIENSSILFLEGGYQKDLIKPCSVRYNSLISKEVTPSLLASGKKPSMCFADIRAQLQPKKQRQYLDDMNALFSFCNVGIRLLKEPTTASEALEMILRKDTPHELVKEPEKEFRELADRMIRLQEKWNRVMIEKIRYFSARNHSCFLIAGVAHCITMHIKTGWPLEITCNSSDGDARNFLLGYLNVNVLAKTIRGY